VQLKKLLLMQLDSIVWVGCQSSRSSQSYGMFFSGLVDLV
jgi:hypothetical protein